MALPQHPHPILTLEGLGDGTRADTRPDPRGTDMTTVGRPPDVRQPVTQVSRHGPGSPSAQVPRTRPDRPAPTTQGLRAPGTTWLSLIGDSPCTPARGRPSWWMSSAGWWRAGPSPALDLEERGEPRPVHPHPPDRGEDRQVCAHSADRVASGIGIAELGGGQGSGDDEDRAEEKCGESPPGVPRRVGGACESG